MKRYVELVNKAENIYTLCWEVLCLLKKHTTLKSINNFMRFQVELAKILFLLEKEVIKISQQINKNKKVANDELLSEKLILTKCINIGKTIGDAFVWVFYVNSLDFLEKHQTQKSNGLSPATKDIFAEILFLEKWQFDKGYLYLYHGITNSYRLGDFSIYDINKGKIIGIIELKTKYFEQNRISQEVYVLFLSELSKNYINALNIKSNNSANNINTKQEAEDRKKRQLLRIGTVIKSINEFPTLEVEVKETYSLQKSISMSLKKSKYGFSVIPLAPYMCAIVYKSTKRKLLSLLSENIEESEELDKLEVEKVEDLILNKSWENSIRIGGFLYEENKPIIYPGIPPLFWQIDDLVFVKYLYFSKISISTVFNTGSFHCRMLTNNWAYNSLNDYYHKNVEGKTIEIYGREAYLKMMCYFYITEDYIFETINQITTVALKNTEMTTKVTAEINLRMV